MAVAKVVDQSAIESLCLRGPCPLALRVIDPWCRWRGRANLPRLGEAFRHAYLGFCVGEPGIDHRGAFLAHLSRARDRDYAYAFIGLSEEEAPARRQFMGRRALLDHLRLRRRAGGRRVLLPRAHARLRRRRCGIR